jgi:hypothetical protein
LICHRSCYWNFVNFKKKKKPHAISSCYYTLMQTPDNKQIARCHAAIAYDMARPFPQRVRKKSFWEFQARWGKEALFSSNVSLYQKCETSSNQFLKGLRSKGCKARSIRCGRMGRTFVLHIYDETDAAICRLIFVVMLSYVKKKRFSHARHTDESRKDTCMTDTDRTFKPILYLVRTVAISCSYRYYHRNCTVLGRLCSPYSRTLFSHQPIIMIPTRILPSGINSYVSNQRYFLSVSITQNHHALILSCLSEAPHLHFRF